MWATCLLVLVALSLGFMVADRLSRHLNRLRRFSSGLASGETDFMLLPKGPDEIGALSRALEDLAAELRNTVVSREYFENVINSMSEGIVARDLSGEIVYTNRAAREILSSLEKGESLECAREMISLYDEACATSEGNDSKILSLPSTRPNEISIRRSHLLDQHGGLQGTVFIVEDVTARERMRRSLAEHRERLIRDERISALGTLGAIVAHKLSQPISSVRLFLQQTERELGACNVPERVKENVSVCLAELGRISSVMKQMMQSGNRPAGSSSKDASAHVSAAIERVFASLNDSASRKRVSLTRVEPAAETRVVCTELELEEMLYCLLNNSIQASDPSIEATVNVTTEEIDGAARISVTDSCHGIPHDHLDKIFDCFFTTKPEGQGTGLGLAIVRHIAERYGGNVTVDSREGIGTTFTITLPVSGASAHEPYSDDLRN
jgi:signal transduction histidine kinase/HAMP domain-containing protein